MCGLPTVFILWLTISIKFWNYPGRYSWCCFPLCSSRESAFLCNSVCHAGNMAPWRVVPTRNISKVRPLIATFCIAVEDMWYSQRSFVHWETLKARNDFNLVPARKIIVRCCCRHDLEKVRYFYIFSAHLDDAFLSKNNHSDYTEQNWISKPSTWKIFFKICRVHFISYNFHFQNRLISSN